MRTISIFIVILSISFSLSAQRSSVNLAGRVIDAETRQGLPGANIFLADIRLGTVTDAQGNYSFQSIPPGHHTVEVTYTGYNAVVEHFDVYQNTEKNYVLSHAITEQQGVTITGVAHATSIRNAPIPVILVRKNEMLQKASTNIVDMLSRQPGISQVSTGPAISKPVIRGLSFNRIVVVNDGLRQEGQQWGEEHGIEIDELSVTRAEVLKGPGSLMYGSDALGGVVNFITNIPAPEGTVRGNIFTNYQTNNKLQAYHANLAGNKNGFNWNIYGSGRSAKDYKNPYDGKVLNSRFNELNFGGYAGINKHWGYSHLIVSSFNQNLGLVEGDRDDATGRFIAYGESTLERIALPADFESRTPLTPYQNVRHYKVVSDNNLNFGRHRVKLNAGFQNNLRKEFGDPFSDEPELFFDLKTFNYNLQWTLPQKRDWQATVGLSGMAQNNLNKGEEVIIPEYDLFDIGAFVYTQRFFANTTFSGGLRFDRRSIDSKRFMDGTEEKFTAFNRSFSNISGSAGLSHKAGQHLTLKANVARGFRAPTLSELASNGAHEGSNRYEYGMQNLNSEKSFQADLGLEWDYQHVSFSLNGFFNRINDYIFYRRLTDASGADSIINVNGEDLEAFQYSQQNARLAGVEAFVDLHPHPLDWLHFKNTFSLVNGWFTTPLDGSTYLPQVPPARWISELRGDFKKLGNTLSNFYLMVEGVKAFNQDRPFTGYNTETATAGYFVLNSGAGADLVNRDGKTIVSVHLLAANITNKAYQDHLSRLKYTDENLRTGRQGVFNMGRNFSIKLNVPLLFSK